MIQFDEKDDAIRMDRMALRDAYKGPRLGDFVRFSNGVAERISHDHGEGVQTSPLKWGSFYLGQGGNASFSGGLNPAVAKSSLEQSIETMDGEFWFFHHGSVGAHRGVYFKIPCRVFECAEEYKGFLK